MGRKASGKRISISDKKHEKKGDVKNKSVSKKQNDFLCERHIKQGDLRCLTFVNILPKMKKKWKKENKRKKICFYP